MNTLQNRLKLGFAIYIAGSFTLFLQFFLYLLQSNIASTTDFAGYGYYLVAAFAHAGLFALIPYLLYILMSLACPFPRFNQGLLITFYFLLNIIAYLNGLVFQLYKFHINGLKTANYLISRSLCMQHFKCTFSACLCRCFKPIFDTKCRNLPATILSIDCKQVNGKIRNYPSPGFPSATERQHHSQYRYHLSVTSVDFK